MKRGFTLIETVVVVAIIGVLAGISFTSMEKVNRGARLQSFCDEASSLIRKGYKIDSSAVNFDFAQIAFEKDLNGISFKLYKKEKNNEKIVETVENNNVVLKEIKINGAYDEVLDKALKDGFNFKFNSDGTILISNSNTSENKADILELVFSLKNSETEKTIELKSLPPGSVVVK